MPTASFGERLTGFCHLPDWAGTPWLLGPATFLLTVLLGMTLKRFLYTRVQAWASRTRTGLDDLLLSALDRPLALLIVGAGLVFMTRHFDLGSRADAGILLAYRVLGILSMVLFTDRLLTGLVTLYAAREPAVAAAQAILRAVSHALVYGLSALVVLRMLDFDITPLLASLGVGSLAVALALQEPLSNLFSGFVLLLDRPIQAGHYVHIDDGVEGHVESVGWRATRIRTLENNLVLVPNARLVASIITNYDRPETEMAVPVPVGVHYASDLPRVEAVTLEVIAAVLTAHGMADCIPRTKVLFTDFGDSAVGLRAVLRSNQFERRRFLIHDFIKALHARYDREGIVIPYPIRTLELGDSARKALGGLTGTAPSSA